MFNLVYFAFDLLFAHGRINLREFFLERGHFFSIFYPVQYCIPSAPGIFQKKQYLLIQLGFRIASDCDMIEL